MSKLSSILCAVLAVSGASVAAAQDGESSITGTVKMEGDAKKPKNLKGQMAQDKFCGPANAGKDVFDEELVVGADKSVANVLVYIKKAPAGKYPAPSEKAEIDQHGCIYQPHVVVVQVGQTLTIKNSDATMHNIHGTPKLNPEFNEGQGNAGMTSDKVFNNPEIGIKIKCDVHGWMAARLHVMEHPFWAKTGADGKFEIKKLPKGTYTVEIWHEKLKGKAVEVTVGDKEAKEQNFTLTKAE